MVKARTVKIEDIPSSVTRCLELDIDSITKRFKYPQLLWLGTIIYVERNVLAGLIVSFWSVAQNRMYVVHYAVLDAFANYGVERAAIVSLMEYGRRCKLPFNDCLDFVLSPVLSDTEHSNMLNLVAVLDKQQANKLLEIRHEIKKGGEYSETGDNTSEFGHG
jgi:hypothetical protein